ncbi:tape measure protein [uncultured Mediterranean phage uvMED]|nr:tape measure protein [uncultured Mediterranean phage uvMED]BAQ90950.1 tape measure protein [uncultured Mediterranean phage uvMED]
MATKKVNIDIIAKDKSKQALKNVQGNLDKVKSSAGKLKAALAAIGGALVVREVLRVTAEFEDLRDSLKSVTGSAEGGAKAFEFISDFATRTQFSVQDLSRSFITLKASGIEPTEKLLRVFTDTAAVTTDQLGVLEAMTRVFSRGVQGGLGLEELNQIADRGIPVFKILEQQLGITRLEISKFGQTTEGAAKILKALEKGLGETFAGATEEKLDNLSVSFSNFGIALDNLKDAFGQEVSPEVTRFTNNLAAVIQFVEPLIKLLGKLASFLLSAVNFAFEAVGKSVSFVVTKFDQFLRFIGIVDEEVAKNVKTLDELAAAAKKTGEAFEEITIKDMPIVDINEKTRKEIEANDKLLEKIKQSHMTELELLAAKQEKELGLVEEQRQKLEAMARLKIEQGSDREYEMQILEKHLKTLNELEMKIMLEGIKERLAIVKASVDEEMRIKQALYDKNLQAIKDRNFNELELDKLTDQQKKDLTMASGRELLGELAKHNKTMFQLNKALAIKDAIVSTAQGVTKALAMGPFGIPLAGIIAGLGAAQIATIASQKYQGRRLGGRMNQGQPYMVGEAGPEMVVPDRASNVVPNNQLGGGQPVTVNFNINTVDARGFNELLVNSRGVIVNMINSAVNEKGKAALI